MASRKNIAPASNQSPAASPQIQRATTFGSALVDLFKVAQNQLSGDDLAALSSGLFSSAHLLSKNIATVCESVGCTIGGGYSGAFEGPEDVSELLFMIGTMNDLISSAVFVGSDAEEQARERSALSGTGRAVPTDLKNASPEGSA